MGKKLYVGNLSYDMNNSALETLFAPHGTVESAQVIEDLAREKTDESVFLATRGHSSSRRTGERSSGRCTSR